MGECNHTSSTLSKMDVFGFTCPLQGCLQCHPYSQASIWGMVEE